MKRAKLDPPTIAMVVRKLQDSEEGARMKTTAKKMGARKTARPPLDHRTSTSRRGPMGIVVPSRFLLITNIGALSLAGAVSACSSSSGSPSGSPDSGNEGDGGGSSSGSSSGEAGADGGCTRATSGAMPYGLLGAAAIAGANEYDTAVGTTVHEV